MVISLQLLYEIILGGSWVAQVLKRLPSAQGHDPNSPGIKSNIYFPGSLFSGDLLLPLPLHSTHLLSPPQINK